jgi:hypothetical protein
MNNSEKEREWACDMILKLRNEMANLERETSRLKSENSAFKKTEYEDKRLISILADRLHGKQETKPVMMESIKDIAKQVGFNAVNFKDAGERLVWYGIDMESDTRFEDFGKSIVNKCIDICDNSCVAFDIDVWINSTKKDLTAHMAHALANEIKKRFGMED